MPRCGCGTACSCELDVKPPLKKTGTGTARDHWVLSLDEDLGALLADKLGPGLTYDKGTGKLQVRLSHDASQTARFGSDDGVLAPATDEGPGDPKVCGKSLAKLADTGVTGAYLMAGLINPFNSPYGLNYCIANDIDICHVRTVATADKVAWLAEYSSGNVSTARSTVTADGAASKLDTQTIAATYNTAGNADGPMPGKGEGRPDGGWYGWGAQKYWNWLLPELLERANGKIIVLADCLADEGEGNAVDEGANVAAACRAGQQMCAEGRMLIGVAEVASAQTAANRGFQAIMLPRFVGAKVKVGEKKLPYKTEELKNTVKWIALSEKYDDSVFQAYKDAGLSVLMVDSSRQHLEQRAAKVARGRLNLDPVYARGVGQYDYRGQYDPWARHRMCLGQLTAYTDDFLVTGTMPRGYTKVDAKESRRNGLVINSRFGGGHGRPSVLIGHRSPVAEKEYSVTWDMQFETLPHGKAAGKIGLLFGAKTDAETLIYPKDAHANPSEWPVGQHEMYRAYLRVDGRLGIGVWSTEGEYQSKEVHTDAPKANAWMEFELTVTADAVELERKGKGGGKVKAESSAWRGPYLFLEKEELHPEDEKYGFRAGFRLPKVAKAGGKK